MIRIEAQRGAAKKKTKNKNNNESGIELFGIHREVVLLLIKTIGSKVHNA